ncbi:ABZJ_00895 family protein [Gordonia alkaliphila]|uniref:ABZJ_00895 family protein n=1 Tax=Gordonia alkaliphila TaxID=1053547 RepID=UPI001FF3F8BE|nr:ABZJ_00895 family protein [Gordonia alkaliphila]MCK0439098.1 ABZJ_00895 family protein [Gordonia alkaliphila]
MTDQPDGLSVPGGKISLWKYLGIFVGVAVLASLFMAMLESLLDTDVAFVSLLVPLFAVMTAIDVFVKDHLRVPTNDEKWWLIWWSFGVSVAWSLVVLVVLVLMYDDAFLSDMPGILTVALVVGVVLTFLVIWAGYAGWPKRALANRHKYLQRQAAKGR